MSGASGVGKTMLAKITAKENGGELYRIHAPSLNKSADLSIMLLSMKDRDILFIDEIHALSRESAETLFEAMSEQHISVASERGETPVTLDIADISVIGATTDHNRLPEAFRNRFVRHLRLQEYSVNELILILKNSLTTQITSETQSAIECITDDDLSEIAARSRGRARNALSMLNVLIDHALCRLDKVSCESVFAELGVGPHGVNQDDRDYLKCFSSARPVGLTTIAGTTRLDRNYIENTIEPFLISLGIIEKTARGRIVNRQRAAMVGVAV